MPGTYNLKSGIVVRDFFLQLIDQVDKKGRNASEVKCNVNSLINCAGLCDIVTYSGILSKTKRSKVLIKKSTFTKSTKSKLAEQIARYFLLVCKLHFYEKFDFFCIICSSK